jgi:hypothetical protein
MSTPPKRGLFPAWLPLPLARPVARWRPLRSGAQRRYVPVRGALFIASSMIEQGTARSAGDLKKPDFLGSVRAGQAAVWWAATAARILSTPGASSP